MRCRLGRRRQNLASAILYTCTFGCNITDICGNFMGDIGARLLAKALQINNKLRYISLDRNNVTLQGKLAFKRCVNKYNYPTNFHRHDFFICRLQRYCVRSRNEL